MPGSRDEHWAVQPSGPLPPPQMTSASASDAEPAAPSAPSAEAEQGKVVPDMPTGWSDVLTGTDGPRLWDRIVASEQARNDRHHRTATIALVEFAGIDAIAKRWGHEMAMHLFLRLARVLASGIRSSDHIARIGRTRFGVLLVETDEVLAINFVDRIRARCAAELEPAGGVLVAIGWASPPPGGHLADAHELAVERVEGDLRHQT
jgi:diguanylate cyclase (GGDEF)-like protein